jgi:hypothetical protein
MAKGSSDTPTVFTLKISIKDTRPLVWRRVTLPGSSTLEELHQILQTVFYWYDSHLHEFLIDGRRFGYPEQWEEDANDIEDESAVTLDGLRLKPGRKFLYTYDFGDDWRHAIVVEKQEGSPPMPSQPIRCVAGQRRAPREDCGGPWGWADLIKAVHDPAHPEHRDLLEWAGGVIDPDEFDLEEINERLAAPLSGRFPRR